MKIAKNQTILSMSNKNFEAKNPLVFPSVDNMVADALEVIKLEIKKYHTKVASGRSLDSREAKTLQGYIKSLVDLSREDRERTKDVDLASLTAEELIALLGPKATKSLTGKIEK